MGSSKFSLNKDDVIKVSKNALFVAVAAGLAYIGQHVSNVDLGPATAFVVPVIAMCLNTVVQWAKDNTKE